MAIEQFIDNELKGEFVGGCDIIREMFQAGELKGLLKEKGVAVAENASA